MCWPFAWGEYHPQRTNWAKVMPMLNAWPHEGAYPSSTRGWRVAQHMGITSQHYDLDLGVFEACFRCTKPQACYDKKKHSRRTGAWDGFPKGDRVESHAAAPPSPAPLRSGGQGLSASAPSASVPIRIPLSTPSASPYLHLPSAPSASSPMPPICTSRPASSPPAPSASPPSAPSVTLPSASQAGHDQGADGKDTRRSGAPHSSLGAGEQSPVRSAKSSRPHHATLPARAMAKHFVPCPMQLLQQGSTTMLTHEQRNGGRRKFPARGELW